MQIITDIKKIRTIIAQAKRRGQSIGFVPTMGALHTGHASLIQKSRRENAVTVLSVFVNPKQFGAREDFAAYPREKNKDCLFAKKQKVDIIFYPSVNKIYPRSFLTSIKVDRITKTLCGRFRPGHFDGVALVVTKLLNIVTPDVLYLGQKDAQQCAVLKQLVRDLDIPVKINICPTVRENDGLAMSSRNQYLTPKQRREAPVLYRALRDARQKIQNGERRTARVIKHIAALIRHNSSGRIQYIECVNADTLQPLQGLRGEVLIALAVWFGKARLIDNIIVKI
ncbi:MAG: pantoate--beta-alanine ligase [Omnitrophica WOR_2 bacterium RIFCSPHIGHO2_01_FULL_48_9]|nr:MAG: pantoate--beta-alanine ligase [Omnitrophica WOR_2 bacterium RIFCSPHIGHO2_02_FULL_48_11]OGX31950.1 MAG: pantoate--beta-alanine ligase [Omnitrophica WOR_2 bacterium RIFCSPHIGHO2_01_FULL_48_9]